MFNGFEDMQNASRDSMEVAMKSFGSMGQSVQAIAAEYADFAKKSFEDGTAAFEKAAGAKSLDKAIEAQTAYAKSSYEGFVGEANKLGEMYADLAKEAFKPFEGFVSKVGK